MELVKEQYSTKPEKMQDLIKEIRKKEAEIYEKVTPEEVSKRKNADKMKLSDADIITLSIVGEMVGVNSEHGRYAYCMRNLVGNIRRILRAQQVQPHTAQPAWNHTADIRRGSEAARHGRYWHCRQCAVAGVQVRQGAFPQKLQGSRRVIRQMRV